LKVEISKRNIKSEYEVKNFLGISMLVMKKQDMAAAKLAALLTRKKFATRDMYDLWFFLKNSWEINEDYLKKRMELSLVQSLEMVQPLIKQVKNKDLLSGLGELLDNKQKAWAKEKLQDELLFLIKLYLSLISK